MVSGLSWPRALPCAVPLHHEVGAELAEEIEDLFPTVVCISDYKGFIEGGVASVVLSVCIGTSFYQKLHALH